MIRACTRRVNSAMAWGEHPPNVSTRPSASMWPSAATRSISVRNHSGSARVPSIGKNTVYSPWLFA